MDGNGEVKRKNLEVSRVCLDTWICSWCPKHVVKQEFFHDIDLESEFRIQLKLHHVYSWMFPVPGILSCHFRKALVNWCFPKEPQD